jgi:hypothetical protein
LYDVRREKEDAVAAAVGAIVKGAVSVDRDYAYKLWYVSEAGAGADAEVQNSIGNSR